VQTGCVTERMVNSLFNKRRGHVVKAVVENQTAGICILYLTRCDQRYPAGRIARQQWFECGQLLRRVAVAQVNQADRILATLGQLVSEHWRTSALDLPSGPGKKLRC
jgi:hypothetical protein